MANTQERTPLEAFLHHQGRALEETGRALASLLPREFRTHAGNALDESCASFKVLVDGVIDGVQDTLDWLRSTPAGDEPGKEKVKVDVD